MSAARKIIETQPERVQFCAAVKLPDGTVLTGPTHSICLDDAAEAGALDAYLSQPYEKLRKLGREVAWEELEPLLRDSVDGFLPTDGRFVDRAEAFKIASQNGQVSADTNSADEQRLDIDDLVEGENPKGLFKQIKKDGNEWILHNERSWGRNNIGWSAGLVNATNPNLQIGLNFAPPDGDVLIYNRDKHLAHLSLVVQDKNRFLVDAKEAAYRVFAAHGLMPKRQGARSAIALESQHNQTSFPTHTVAEAEHPKRLLQRTFRSEWSLSDFKADYLFFRSKTNGSYGFEMCWDDDQHAWRINYLVHKEHRWCAVGNGGIATVSETNAAAAEAKKSANEFFTRYQSKARQVIEACC